MNIAVIIAAAGSSSRYMAAGGLRSKLDEDLGERPVLQRTMELFTKRDEVSSIIVAGPYEDYDEFKLRHGDKLAILGVQLCRGGKGERWETVKAGLELVPDDCTHIAVHDAARPCASPELFDRIFDAASSHPAV
ncbi:MAG: 2-C-methyl-D-erythritol 4-phosphate cytidylyltransferase, partial [Planctomycetota bacterium]